MQVDDALSKPSATESTPASAPIKPATQFAANDKLPSDGEVIQPQSFTPASQDKRPRRLKLRPLYITTATALLILFLVAGFLFIAKSVTFEPSPAVAEVSVQGGMVIPFGDGYLLLKGEYQVTATAPGYYDLNETVAVTAEQNQIFQLPLQKLPGHLTVTANVNESGEVWIDGEQRGTLNAVIDEIKAGEHRIEVVTNRYLPYSTTLEIEGLDKQQELAIELAPAWAEVAFVTDPPGAELAVDGEAVASTPAIAEILQGERQVTLSLPGYKSWQDILDITAGQAITIPPIALEKADGLVVLESNPMQASVTINNNYYGQTPVEVALAPGRSYQITLFKDGFQPAQRKVTITSGQKQALNVTLSPNLGQIRVKATPEDALLYVNGRLMGRADQTLTLPASQTTLSIKKEGYADYQTTVLPRPNLEQFIPVKLKTVEEARWASIPATITTKAGQTLKLFKPNDTFTMGSSRREQGRRANEALHTVQLTRAFYLSTHEVTNGQFRQFKADHSSGNVKGNSLNGDDYPVVNVTWQQAALYCNWLSEKEQLPPYYRVEDGAVTGFNPQSTGYRLSTETEWAWATRLEKQGDHATMLKYTWGPQLPPTSKVINIADRNAAPVAGFIQAGYDDGFIVSAPVGSFPANAKGLYDLDGNVAEWMNDYYDVASSLAQDVSVDPIGPSDGTHHVIRGSSWAHGTITELRLSFRDYGTDARNDVGFRIARYVE